MAVGADALVPVDAKPVLGSLDFLGRMPIPLRRPFKAGLDRVVTAYRDRSGVSLNCCFLSGGEWYKPFDDLVKATNVHDLPAMVVSSWSPDILSVDLLAYFADGAARRRQPLPVNPICADFVDPEGVFSLFSVIPLVFLIDLGKLGKRPVPRCWEDILDPIYHNDVTFGGWRLNDRVPYRDFNEFLLHCLLERFGVAGLEAFAANVKGLVHNVRTARLCGSCNDLTGAIAILPWLQADLCPRRELTRIVWPEDGAFAMPIGYLLKDGEEERLSPVIDYLNSRELAGWLAKNRYPPSSAEISGAFPDAARLQWPGWDYVRSHDLVARCDEAARIFFSAHPF